MPTTGVFEIRSGRAAAVAQPLQHELIDDLPAVPALPETLLLMELRMRQTSVDLREISDLVLGDLGATLQVFRLAALEFGDSEDRPRRIEDCISSLGLDACLLAAAAASSAGDGCDGPAVEFWAHSRDVAQICRELAAQTPGSVSPAEAYQVGLLHGIGLLPCLLGWNLRDRGFLHVEHTASALAKQWRLPACVQRYLCEPDPRKRGPWGQIAHTAHIRARRSPVCSSPAGGLLLQMRRTP